MTIFAADKMGDCPGRLMVCRWSPRIQLFFVFLLLPLAIAWPSGPVRAQSIDIDIFPDANHKTIALADPACHFMIDSTLNFSVTKIGQALHIEGLAQGTSGALLIVTCPGVDDAVYNLNYHNISSQAPVVAETNQIPHPEAYLESSVLRNSAGDALWTNRLVDRTYKPVQIQIDDSRDPAHGDRWQRSYDVTHTIDDEHLVYHGRTLSVARTVSAESYRGGFEARFLGGGVSRTFLGAKRYSDSYYVSLMEPLSLQFRGRDHQDGTWFRSLSKNIFFSAQDLSGRTTISGHATDRSRYVQGSQTLTRRLTSGTNRSWFNAKSSLICRSAEHCKFQELVLGPSMRGRDYFLALDHQLVPHATTLSGEWNPTALQTLMVTYRHQHKGRGCASKLCEDPSDGMASRDGSDFLQTDYGVGYRHGILLSRVDVQQPLWPAESRRSTNVSLGLGEEHERWSWDVLAAHDIWRGRQPPSFFASVRVYSDDNLSRAALWLRKHRLNGVLLSSITKQPIANAQIVLTHAGKIRGQTLTAADGSYALNDIPQSGTMQLEIMIGNIREQVTLQKDYRDVSIEKDLFVADFLTVQVRFLLDSNKNGIMDASDAPVSLVNEFPEIQDAVVTGPGVSVASDRLLFPRGTMIPLRVNQAMLPNRYGFLAMTPEQIDSTKDTMASVMVLLKEVE
jgi:hypothetical protein